MAQFYYQNEPPLRKVNLLKTDFIQDGYRIMFDHTSKDAPSRGASNICYNVLVKHEGTDEKPIPMILKEFYPCDPIFESAISRDATGKLCYQFSRGMEAQSTDMLKRKKAALEDAYAIQRQLATANETMGIVVKPVYAWSPDEFTYYTLHEANWAKSLDKDPPTDIKEILSVMCRAAEAVGRMEHQGYVHGDLKPENILYTDRGFSTASIRLFDFDCSCNYRKGKYPDSLRGSDGYNAPELREADSIFGIEGIYKPRLDVYSLGAVLFWLLLQKHPTVEDENSDSYDSAPFYGELIHKFEYVWREQLSREYQNKLAEIVWRSIRAERHPRKENSRYKSPSILAEEFKKLLKAIGSRPLPVDEVSRSSYTMLSAQIISEYPLYDYMKPDTDRVNIVLAGISPMRDAFLEHFLSSCQMLNREIHIHIIAPHVEDYLREIVQKEFGKIVSIKLNGKAYTGSGYFPNSEEIVEGKLAILDCWCQPLAKDLRAFSADYYLLVDTNSDLNYEIARQLLEHPHTHKAFIGYTDSRGDGYTLRELPLNDMYDVSPIGCNELFSVSEVAFQSEIINRAYKVHMRYNTDNRKEFLEGSAYNKSSSIRAALSLSYEAYSVGIDLREKGSAAVFQELFNQRGEDYNKLLWLEHRAWTGFMVMQGYKRPTNSEVMEYAFRGRNDQREKNRLLHPCVCPSRITGLRLDKDNPDWDDSSHDAEYDPLDQFSLFFHRFCGSKVNKNSKQQIRKFSDNLCLEDAENEEEKTFVNTVHSACEAMLNGENAAWNNLHIPETLNDTLKCLFYALETKIKFLHEYNRFCDFKALDADILSAVPDIFSDNK